MKCIMLYRWSNSNPQTCAGYTTSYSLRCGGSELFKVDLRQQNDFYQISEFVSPHGRDNFTIEQLNKSRRAKIAAFDKETGASLGVLKENVLYDLNETKVFHLCPKAEVRHLANLEQPEGHPDDWIAVTGDQSAAAIFHHLPAPVDPSRGSISRLCVWLGKLSRRTRAVMQVNIYHPEICELRMLCAVAVVIHRRRRRLRRV